MNDRLFLLLTLVIFAGLTSLTKAAIVAEDGFELETIGPLWSVSSTNQGRVTVSTEHGPASGARHLILDDSVGDAASSAAEATLTLDLTNRKNTVLAFKAKSLGNEPHPAPSGNFSGIRNYDGVAISVNGGLTWRAVQSLSSVGSAWESFSIPLDAGVTALSGSYGPDFRIRFSGYDNAPVPIDGLAIDEVSVSADEDQRSLVELPSVLTEGTGPHTGYVVLAFPPAAPVSLTLSAQPAGQLILPGTIMIAAGQTAAAFEFSVADDNLANLTRTIVVTASSSGITSGSAQLTLLDNDVPKATLTLPPAIKEGSQPVNNATLVLDKVPSAAITLTLSASPTGELTLPATVTVPAGQTQVTFTVRAVNDTKIDGDIPVVVTAIATGVLPATASTTAEDDEVRILSLTIPATLLEGSGGSATLGISGTLATPLAVSLTSNGEADLTFPVVVTIPPGQIQATFTLTAADNLLQDGTRSANLTASAPGFPAISKVFTVRDNEVGTYRFGALTDLVNASSPLNVSVTAADVEGNVINGYAGTVNLTVVLPDGSQLPLVPASVNLAGAAGWSGTVTLPSIASAPLRLRAGDAVGNLGNSTPFDLLRSLALPANDLLWNAARNVIYASVPGTAVSPWANKVVVINPATLQITGSVTTNQDPGQLALTSGGEVLYAALNANGTIARIDPATLTITSTFAVGTDPSYGTLYAGDICTVAGQPDLLLISQNRKSVSPAHNGVTVYENGVRRGTKTQDHTGSNLIEPSSDPSIYFGYNTESTEYGFRRLQLDANGLKELVVDRNLINGFSIQMVSEGNRVYTSNGVVVEGAQMKRLGTFGTTGQVRPDAASNRVFFLEPQGNYFSSSYDRISAWDPTNYSLIRRLSLPSPVESAASLIRWGGNGLAYRTATTVYLLSSSQLVPSDPPANLVVTTTATPNPATTGNPLTYTVEVTNQGPNPARTAILNATLSDSQTIQSVTADTGNPATNGLGVSLPLGDLAAGATARLTIVTLPQSAGTLTIAAAANSNAVDPDFGNNSASKLVSVGFVSGLDVVNQLRLTANNVIYDPTRKLLWVTIPATVAAPLGKSILSINPINGLVSDPLPINANPMAQSMALSADGHYLYVGLSDITEIHRVDLTSPAYASLRVPLGANAWGGAGYADDIEVLDGNGTSILVTTTGDESAIVFDGTVRRANRTGIYTVNRIERTTTPGVFVGYDNAISSYPTSRLSITSSGVAITQTVNGLMGYGNEIRGSGNLLLSNSGQLVNSGSLTLLANLGSTGRPCIDGPYQRAYLFAGNALRGFDTATGATAGSLSFPTTQTGDWAQSLDRWGVDGFAVLGTDRLYITRWSGAVPANADVNLNKIADPWEARHFGALATSSSHDLDEDGIMDGIEYLFATSPSEKSVNPAQFSVSTTDGAHTLHLVFPRRSGLVAGSYGYLVSADLQAWRPPAQVTETVLSSRTVDGVTVEIVDAAIPTPAPSGGFVRLNWLGP